jgi:Exonuclease
MAYVMVDVEADGPIPGEYSMVCFGAVLVKESLDTTFYGRLKPVSDKWIPSYLAISGFGRQETLSFDEPKAVMESFARWVIANTKGRAFFVSDNNGFDWQFMNWYFWHFTGGNPFGHSSTNLGSLYKGMVKDVFQNFKHLRKTAHTHNPLDDAMGNAEALLEMKRLGLKIGL